MGNGNNQTKPFLPKIYTEKLTTIPQEEKQQRYNTYNKNTIFY